MTATKEITVVGAGILGLWQALTLVRAGHRVRLVEQSHDPLSSSDSRFAGAMLAPDIEAESAPPIVREMGIEGLALWRAACPLVVNAGSLVVAQPRDRAELTRLGRLTRGHTTLDEKAIEALEPDLAGRYVEALYFADEAHLATTRALSFLMHEAAGAGVTIELGTPWRDAERVPGIVVDCRGLAARTHLDTLRGVRGERVLIRSADVRLSRPVRLLHPRHPLYVVPWGDGLFVVGATMIESEDKGAASVRSALELLGTAYALHPAFGEAEIVDIGAGVRPAFPDNVPRGVVRRGGRWILVNGAYRHGFLLAPVLAKAVAEFISSGQKHALLVEG